MLKPESVIILVQAIVILLLVVALLELRRRHRRLRHAYYAGVEQRHREAWDRVKANGWPQGEPASCDAG